MNPYPEMTNQDFYFRLLDTLWFDTKKNIENLLPKIPFPSRETEFVDMVIPGYDPSLEWREDNVLRRPYPFRAFYEVCSICKEKDCTKFHRWLTQTGYAYMAKELVILNSMSRDERLPWPEFIGRARLNYGGSLAPQKECSVCKSTDNCRSLHRFFTVEGYCWYLRGFFRTYETPLSYMIRDYAERNFLNGKFPERPADKGFNEEHFGHVVQAATEDRDLLILLRSIEGDIDFETMISRLNNLHT